ncbi:hypothetical protein [Roseicyclus sp.]|jgi:hypothetical protein
MNVVFPWIMCALIVAGFGAAGWMLSGSGVVALGAALASASFVRPGRA